MRNKTYPMVVTLTAVIVMLAVVLLPVGLAASDLLSSDKPLSIKVRDVDVRDILRIIAEEYGLNIVIGKGVEGRISYELENTSLKAGFEAILKSNGLGYVAEDNIIRVDDLKTLRMELQEELEIHRTRQQLEQARKLDEPLQTKEIPLDYIGDTLSSRKGKVKELKETLEPLLSHKKEKGVDRGANIQLLGESNTLIVTDVAENLREIEALAKQLDRAPAQVRIEARVVEINHSDSLGLGIQWGASYQRTDTDGRTQAVGGRRGDSTGSMLGTAENLGVDLPISGEFAPLGTIGYTLLDNLSLDVEIQAMESKGKLRLVSKPSVQVLENESARILVGSQVPVAQGLDPETGQVEVAQQDIGTTLEITPQVVDDCQIIMQVDVERSEIGLPVQIQSADYFTINKRSATSQVRVNDGETIVIGGMVFEDKSRNEQSVPFFSKIPILGLLFRSRTEEDDFDETMIFLTPHIVKEGKS